MAPRPDNMSEMSSSPRRVATVEDLLAIPEEARFHELLGGEIIRKATPSGEHGNAQGGVVGTLRTPFQRPPGRGGPGGWWIGTEIEVRLRAEVVRPDVVGWRRERSPEMPTGTPVSLRPDWVCEVLSPSNASNDTVKKLRLYHLAEIPHYWIVDPREKTLTVMRWSVDGYTTVLAAERGELVRAEPFEATEIDVGAIFGDDPL
jgi:Uma2 family endonuclease